MKIIENLISRYCPDGVEYVDLGEVVVFTDGHSFSSGSFTESGEYQVVKITDCRCYNDVRQEEKRIANRSGL